MASRFLIPSKVSIWITIAAWSLTHSWRVLDGSRGVSERPGIRRAGGAERVPFRMAPYFAAETMCWACSTVSTWGQTIEAPASRAKPMAAWSWPGTLLGVRGILFN
jgi:hypothetical protein